MKRYIAMHKRYSMFMLVLLAILIVTLTGFAWNEKTVTVVADGTTQTIKTHLNSKDGIVKDAGISLGKDDKIILNTSSLQDGSSLTVLRAFPVIVHINGNTKTVMTVQTDVHALADELGYLPPHYIPVGDVTTKLHGGSEVTIEKITSRAVKEYERTTNPQEQREEDNTLAAGTESVVQEGTGGVEKVKEEILYANGKEISRVIVEKKQVSPGTPRVVKVGTNTDVPVTPNISNARMLIMEASAYLPTDGDGRGITASGIYAVRGGVAVDPNVIPLGTRLYIPGYGEAIAADTGGAINGNRIDLLMDSYAECMAFGRQTVQVYILD